MLTDLEIAALVERYARERDRFEKLASTVSRRLTARLWAAALPHVPTFRSKDPESLRNKLDRDREKHEYSDFRREFSPALLDLAGVRMMMYRPRDVEAACEIVQEMFVVASPSRFHRDHSNPEGYQARHRVAVLRPEEVDADPGAGNLRWIPCEVQVVTLGDHIWNELEHDIIYKTPHGRPTEVQAALLKTLRSQLNSVRDSVNQLMEATNRQRALSSAPVQTPEDLSEVLKVRCGRRLRGDYDRLLDLLSGVLRDVTAASIERLPLTSEDLDRGLALVRRAGHEIGVNDVGLVVAALWSLYADEFIEIVRGWQGRPGRLSQLVRALDDAQKAGTI